MEGVRTKIIVGHYGSGKTEFSVNYAFYLRSLGHKVTVADLDIVNPYFRSRQKHKELEAAGISIISNNFKNDWKVDIPSLDRAIESCFYSRDGVSIIDAGGNGVGARVLSRFRDSAADSEYDMWMVVNARRYETQSVDELLGFMRDIEAESRMIITGVINNTHMLRETTPEDILAGEEMVKEIFERTGTPCIYTSFVSGLADKIDRRLISGEPFPMELHMRPRYI